MRGKQNRLNTGRKITIMKICYLKKTLKNTFDLLMFQKNIQRQTIK